MNNQNFPFEKLWSILFNNNHTETNINNSVNWMVRHNNQAAYVKFTHAALGSLPIFTL
jgi:hypothetical protein